MGELTTKPQEKMPAGDKLVKTITLLVKATELWSINYPATFKEIYEHCALSNDGGKTIKWGKELPKFETFVVPGENLEWIGRTKSDESEFTVMIDSIVYAYGKESEIDITKRRNFFDRMALCSQNGKTVNRRVEDYLPTGLDLTNIYWINFRVIKGEEYREYSIDPRLKIK